MKHTLRLLFTLLALLVATCAFPQGMGFILKNGQKIELRKGDNINIQKDASGAPIMVVTSGSNTATYSASDISFYGDIEGLFLEIPASFHYYDFSGNGFWFDWGYGSAMVIRDVMTDDFIINNVSYNWYSSWERCRDIGSRYWQTEILWSTYQRPIEACNALLSALAKNKTLTAVQKNYKGVALAFRAMLYLDIARMYQYLPCDATSPITLTGHDVTGLTVPIVTENTTEADYATLRRATAQEMYDFLKADLEQALTLLDGYVPTSKRIPGKACVYGLLARLSLWQENYNLAAQYARQAINASGCTPTTTSEMKDVQNGFNTLTSSSWMWGSQPYASDMDRLEHLSTWPSWMSNQTMFGYTGPATNQYSLISPTLYSKMGSDDNRRWLFNGTGTEPTSFGSMDVTLPYFASLKFRPYQGEVENHRVACQAAYPLMRVEEMYFIEAEAIAHTDLGAAELLLSSFMTNYRDKAYNPSYVGMDGLIGEIITQKRLELWGEGQTFFDIKRLNLSVDRAKDSDSNYVPQSFRLRSTGRPAWMNLVFPASLLAKMPSLCTTPNPDPSGLYVPGGGIEQDTTTQVVKFVDGIAHDIAGVTGFGRLRSVRTLPTSVAGDLTLVDPFGYLADKLPNYSPCNLTLRISGNKVSIPRQRLSFGAGSGMSTVYSTVDATLDGGIITFPKGSVTVEDANGKHTVGSSVLTEIQLPGYSEGRRVSIVNRFDYLNDKALTVTEVGGRRFLNVYVSDMSGFDEIYLICTNPSDLDDMTKRLEDDPSIGVRATAPGWVTLPMDNVGSEFCLQCVAVADNVLRATSSRASTILLYPDYGVDVLEFTQTINDRREYVVRTYCHVHQHTDFAILALVDIDATEDDVLRQFRKGTLPGMARADRSKGDPNEVVSVDIPAPREEGIYKMVCLAMVDDKVVEVTWPNSGGYFESPWREKRVYYDDCKRNADGSVTVSAWVEVDQYASGVLAILPLSDLQNGNPGEKTNLRDAVINAAVKTDVSGNGMAYITYPNPDPNEQYVLVLAGCDRNGRILGAVAFSLPISLNQEWGEWVANEKEWAANYGNTPWPMGDFNGSCSYLYSAFFSGETKDLPTAYRQNMSDPNRGQLRIDEWCYDVSLVLDIDWSTNKVSIEPQTTGYTEPGFGEFYITDITHWQGFEMADYIGSYDPQLGKLSLWTAWLADNDKAKCYAYGLESVQLGGFYIPNYDYTMQFKEVSRQADGSAYAVVEVASLGVDVEVLRAAVVKEDENDGNFIANSFFDSSVMTELKPGENRIPLNGRDGHLKVVAASYGGGKVRKTSSVGFSYTNSSQWKSLGTGLYSDVVVAPLFGKSSVDIEVEVLESTVTPGLYRFMDPYYEGNYPYPDANGEKGKFVEVDATDKDGVFVPIQSTGLDWGYGDMSILSAAVYYMSNGTSAETLKAEGKLGRLEDGVISLPCFENYGAQCSAFVMISNNMYHTAFQTEWKLVLPEAYNRSTRAASHRLQGKAPSQRTLQQQYCISLPKPENTTRRPELRRDRVLVPQTLGD